MEWYEPYNGAWFARLRFPETASKMVSQDNGDRLRLFAGAQVRIDVVWPKDVSVPSSRAQLRFDETGCLTSTLLPMELDNARIKEYKFRVSEAGGVRQARAARRGR